ncbi:NUDIX domain-containing protein [Zhihengliuella sp.]|uniref:NUDIX hydrolase n=1 Tax=Zhihengliuella sp. TaxID=1954483 RepID=UPI0028119EDC|nr:NUDIX domain-containing protein [Zhihengliuella sp.]
MRRSSDRPDTVDSPAVVAAGVLPWRLRDGELQLLLIHRERYDDWSWPKGKRDAGETLPECAVRETREEVGLDVVLGIPLPAIRYQVKSGPKAVYYWAAEVSERPVPDGDEVDRCAWVTAGEARRQLTNPSDVEPLDALIAAHEAGTLATTPYVVVRHAKAKPRSSWTKAEGERPLAATGQRQAWAVCRLLSCWGRMKLASSPWKRCVQTMSPVAHAQDGKLKLIKNITEAEAERRPYKAQQSFEKLLDKRVPAAVCTHRPVLPIAIELLRQRTTAPVAAFLPDSDPFLRPGAAIVAQQTRDGRIVSIEVVEAYDD